MTCQRYFDEIVAVWTDACDLVLLTRAGREFRMIAEHMIGTLAETKASILERMNRPVKIIAVGNRAELILDV